MNACAVVTRRTVAHSTERKRRASAGVGARLLHTRLEILDLASRGSAHGCLELVHALDLAKNAREVKCRHRWARGFVKVTGSIVRGRIAVSQQKGYQRLSVAGIRIICHRRKQVGYGALPSRLARSGMVVVLVPAACRLSDRVRTHNVCTYPASSVNCSHPSGSGAVLCAVRVLVDATVPSPPSAGNATPAGGSHCVSPVCSLQ